MQIFKRSPLKNEIIQNYVRLEFRKEYFLIADSETRWNSLLAMLEHFYKLKSCIQKSDIDLKLNINFTETDFETVSATISALLPVKIAVESLCCKDANLISADAALTFMFDRKCEIKSSLSIELMSALKQHIIARRTQLSNLISYLHKGLEDSIRNLNLLGFNFPRASKASNLNSLLGIVNQKGLWNQSTAVEERAREILHFEVSEVEIDEGKNSEKSMKKDMYKAICKQINYKVVGKQRAAI